MLNRIQKGMVVHDYTIFKGFQGNLVTHGYNHWEFRELSK